MNSISPTVLSSSQLYRWSVAACAGLGMFLVALDIAVNVALPAITRNFATDVQTIQWIIVSFMVTRAGLTMAAGSFGDMFGLKKVYLAGVVLYTISTTLIAFSPDLGPVFGLRVLQGMGAGSLYAVAPAIAGRAFSAEHRGMAMGMTTASFALGTLTGTLGTGLLLATFGWEIAFLGRVPFCAAALVLGWLVLRDDNDSSKQRSYDVVGSLSLVTTMVVLVLALQLGGRIGWSSPLVVALLTATPLTLAVFVRWELQARFPLLDLRLLHLPGFRATCTGMFFTQMGAFVIWFIFPFFVDQALGRGGLYLGIMLALMAGTMSLASPVSGWLSDRFHPRHIAVFGTLAVAVGLAWMSRLDESASGPEVGIRIAVVGLGIGAFQAAAYTFILKALPTDQFGIGSGSISVAQALGSVVSVALGGLMFALRSADHAANLVAQGMSTSSVEVESLVLAFQDVFRIGAVIAAGGAVVFLLVSLGHRGPAPSR